MPASLFDAEFLARLGTIVVIDLLLAGDNAVVIALAVRSLPKRQQLIGRVFGIALSVPIVVWGSGLLGRLMERFAWVVWMGGGILGYVAGEMFFADPAAGRWVDGAPALAYVVSAILGLVIAAVGWRRERSRRGDVRLRACRTP